MPDWIRTEHQSVWMSKITNDGLTRSAQDSFTHMATVGVKG